EGVQFSIGAELDHAGIVDRARDDAVTQDVHADSDGPAAANSDDPIVNGPIRHIVPGIVYVDVGTGRKVRIDREAEESLFARGGDFRDRKESRVQDRRVPEDLDASAKSLREEDPAVRAEGEANRPREPGADRCQLDLV